MLISIPYYFSYYQIPLIDSLFEAASGLTTTGFTIFTNVKFLDPTLLVWRSASHWIGGLFFLTFLILIFSNFKNDYKLTYLVYNPDKANNQKKERKQLTYAERKGILFVILAREEEIPNNMYVLRNIKTGEKETIDIDTLIQILN